MKKSSKLQKWLKTALGAVVLMTVLTVGLDMSSFTSLADSAGKVTATSAKVRKEPNTSSETVASAAQDATVSVTGQISGSDGYTWYKVSVDGTVGYIRGDLMTITDGSTPPTVVNSTTSSGGSSTATTSTPDETLVDVAEVEPISASVSSSSPVRVRQNASTTSRIVTTAQSGLAVTVVGQATGTDNKEWYQVNFLANGAAVSGFIRADYVTVNGDLVPAGSGNGSENQPDTQEPDTTPEAETTGKAWDTYYDTKWHLVDNTTGNSYDIDQIFSSVEANTKTLQDTLSENKTLQIVVIIMVILVILLATGISFLIFKIKDMSDSEYFNQVEKETLRRRTADRPQGSQKVMQTVGAEGNRRPAQGGQRPASQRPQGAQSGQRPASQRPQGAQSGQRPASQRPQGVQSGQRPASQRPQGAQSGQRPASQRPQGAQSGQRPAGQRSAQGGQRPISQRPAQGGQRPVGQSTQRPAGSVQPPVRQRPVDNQEPVQEVVQDMVTDATIVYEAVSSQNNMVEQPVENTAWQSKNFANEDELEFQFLDWNEEDK